MAKLQRNWTRVLKYHFRQKGGSVFFALLFLLGALIGTRLYVICGEENIEMLTALWGLQQDNSFMELLGNRFLTEALQLLLLFFCGFCAISQPITLFLLFYRGLGLGITGSFLAQQGKESFLYYALLILPQTLIFLLLQITATGEALSFSLNFLRQLFGGGGRNLSIPAKVYVFRFVLLIGLAFAAACGGALLTHLLKHHILP